MSQVVGLGILNISVLSEAEMAGGLMAWVRRKRRRVRGDYIGRSR